MGSMTVLALLHLLDRSFAQGEGTRPKCPGVDIVLMDGQLQKDISEHARNLKEQGERPFS